MVRAAPVWASSSATPLPIPWDAPVTIADLPSKLISIPRPEPSLSPICDLAADDPSKEAVSCQRAAVDHHVLAGDPLGEVADEEQDRVSNVGRLPEPARGQDLLQPRAMGVE